MTKTSGVVLTGAEDLSEPRFYRSHHSASNSRASELNSGQRIMSYGLWKLLAVVEGVEKTRQIYFLIAVIG
ncbi:MAG: hypothetical protein CMJ75_02685 [Planctomycetaceae bacterium]|nr:hypothetical protein [Planctomycetaceae bacterium]